MWVFEEMVNGQKLSDIINQRHENVKYLPGIKLPSNVVRVMQTTYLNMKYAAKVWSHSVSTQVIFYNPFCEFNLISETADQFNVDDNVNRNYALVHFSESVYTQSVWVCTRVTLCTMDSS